MPTSALAAVIGLCATTIGIQIRFFSVLKTDMRSMNGNIVNLGDHVERVEERLNRRIDRVEAQLEARLGNRIDRVEVQLEERLGNRIDRVEESLGQRIELVNVRIDRVEENLGQRIELVKKELNDRIDRVEEGLGQRIELVSSDLTVVGRDVAHVKGQWDTMLTFLPYQKAESVVTSLPS